MKNLFKKLAPWKTLISIGLISINLFSMSLFSFSLFSMNVNLGDLCPESPPVVIVNSQVESMETNRVKGTVPVFANRPSVSWERNAGHGWWNVLQNLEQESIHGPVVR